MNFFSETNKGSLYAIASGLFFGLVGYFGMSIMQAHLSVFTMLFWRFFIASIVVGIIIFTHSLRSTTMQFTRPIEMFKVMLYGAAFYGPSTIIYFIASKSLGTGLAMVIFFTFPAIIMFLHWALYKKPVAKTYYTAMILIMAGMLMLVDLKEFTFDLVGIGLGILSAFFYACYAIASKKSTLPPLLSTLMVSLGCMTTSFVGSIITNTFTMPSSLLVWGHIIGISIICSALPILFFLESLKYISAEKASILSVLEPVFVVIFGITLLGEQVYPLQMLGVIIILVGAMITLKNGSNH